MADNEQKAMQLIAEAEKKLTSSKGFLGSLFGFVFSCFLFVDSANNFWKKRKVEILQFFSFLPLWISFRFSVSVRTLFITFAFSSSGSNKVEDAIECYHRAANMFKMAKKWQQAGGAFCSAGNLHAQVGSRHDAATNYVDASNCFKKVKSKAI